MKLLRCALTLLALQSSLGSAQDITLLKVGESVKPWLPHSTVTQHAAYAGYIAAGFGYEWRDTWSVDLLYGYTPQELAGEVVHSWTLKSFAYLGSIGSKQTVRVRPYLGLSVNYSPDDELFVRLPGQYPEGYYTPTAIRPALMGGLEFKLQNQLALAFEFAVLDSELAYFNDTKTFDSERMGSSGFSLRWQL